jgi:hypothetical protein
VLYRLAYKQQIVSVPSHLSVINLTATKTIKNSGFETPYVEEKERLLEGGTRILL